MTYAIVGCAIVLTFVPMRWVHPMRVVRLRFLTLMVTLVWAVAAILVVWQGFPARPWIQVVLVVVAAYLIGLTVDGFLRKGTTT